MKIKINPDKETVEWHKAKAVLKAHSNIELGGDKDEY